MARLFAIDAPWAFCVTHIIVDRSAVRQVPIRVIAKLDIRRFTALPGGDLVVPRENCPVVVVRAAHRVQPRHGLILSITVVADLQIGTVHILKLVNPAAIVRHWGSVCNARAVSGLTADRL